MSIRSLSRSFPTFILTIALAGLVSGCATSPTGRTQFMMQSEPEMAAMGAAAFADMETKMPASSNAAQTKYVRCVAFAITDILTPEELQSVAVTEWEVVLFEDPTANAFALPGGKMGVNTGLLKVATTPSQLAAVLGHEVGHVLARHGNERVSQATIADSGMQMAQVLMGADTAAKQTLLGALGLGAQYGVLMPFGRTQESEADEIGLKLMARAGFDPRESIQLWVNMGAAAAGPAPPEFMSTHPSNATRISGLEAKLPKAIALYDAAVAAGRRPNCR